MDRATLKQYRALTAEIEQLEAEKKAVIDSMCRDKRLASEIQAKGIPSDPVLKAVAKREQLQGLIDEKLDRSIALRKEVEDWLEKLTSSERSAIRLKYIEVCSWRQVAAKLKYTEDGVRKLVYRTLGK